MKWGKTNGFCSLDDDAIESDSSLLGMKRLCKKK